MKEVQRQKEWLENDPIRLARQKRMKIATIVTSLILMIGIGVGYWQWTIKKAKDDGIAAFDRGDYTVALNKLSPLAQNGDIDAESKLGAMYANGKGGVKDLNKAFELISKAAAQGNAHAQYGLGVMYDNGMGVAQDLDKAKEWYEKAAAQGNAKAQR
jgi:TPR repeat protein